MRKFEALKGISKWTWAWQVVPPLLLLWPASTTHGPSAYWLSGFFTWILLFIIPRILYLLFKPNNPYIRCAQLIRPSLALLISGLALMHFHYSLKPVRAFMNETATRVQAECNQQGHCPKTLQSWGARNDRYSSQIMYGSWIKWPVMYRSNGQKFELQLYKLLDSNLEFVTGGVGQPLLLLPNQLTGY